MTPKIKLLSKKIYGNVQIHFKYDTEEYYDVKVETIGERISFTLERKKSRYRQTKTFVETIYPKWLDTAEVYGIFDKNKLCGIIEIDYEHWYNRLRITELLVFENYRGKGYGKALMNRAVEIATKKCYRSISLEVHSCNTPAIDFYINQGFVFSGVDCHCYTNNDIERYKVKIEMSKMLVYNMKQ